MVADSDGFALQWNGTSWLTPEDVVPSSAHSVSCPTPSWCLVMDQTSYAAIWNGHGWSGPEFTDPEAMALTQHSSSITGQASTTPVSWGQGDPGLVSVSCAIRTFCVAIDYFGYAVTFNGKTWSSPALIGPAQEEDRITCAVPRFCVVTFNGQVTIGRG
jgi:hypothetical protein